MDQLWRSPGLDDPETGKLLVDTALDPKRRCLRRLSLVHARELRLPGLAKWADSLIQHDEIVQALDTAALLRLGPHLTGEPGLARLFAELDDRMAREPEAPTEALLRVGWWSAWRQSSRLGSAELDRVARKWLTSAVWSEGEVTAPLEDWQRVLADLPSPLAGWKVKRLREEAGALPALALDPPLRRGTSRI